MGARTRLNEIHIAGSLAIAGVFGVLAASWTMFFVTGALLVAAGVGNGDIRPSKHGGGQRGHSRPGHPHN